MGTQINSLTEMALLSTQNTEDDSFQHQKHMLKLRSKKYFQIYTFKFTYLNLCGIILYLTQKSRVFLNLQCHWPKGPHLEEILRHVNCYYIYRAQNLLVSLYIFMNYTSGNHMFLLGYTVRDFFGVLRGRNSKILEFSFSHHTLTSYMMTIY